MLTDVDHGALRSVSAAGAVRTIATEGAVGVSLGGTGVLAQMPVGLASANNTSTLPQSVTADPAGNLVITEARGQDVRRISPAGDLTLVAGLTGSSTGALGQSGTADGAIASARLTYPNSVAFAPDGALLFADAGRLRRIAPDGSSISTLATPAGSAAVAGFIAVDSDGTVYYGGSAGSLISHGLYMLPPGAGTPTLLIPYAAQFPFSGRPRMPPSSTSTA